MTKMIFAYSVVFRKADNSMQHYIHHCYATSKQEARGIAHEQFEEDNPDCKLLSLLIREIAPYSDSNVHTHEYQTPFIQPEFTLKDKF